jgi:hypothetical protein
LKDYYQLIDEPMSLKKLWRAIKGMVGRAGATGVSEFKSWAALEEKASLLWNNAFYYNEEGSEIFELAKELKVSQKTAVYPWTLPTVLTCLRTPSMSSSMKPRHAWRSRLNPRSS